MPLDHMVKSASGDTVGLQMSRVYDVRVDCRCGLFVASAFSLGIKALRSADAVPSKRP
jgi:hypothetical protein